MAQFTTPRLRSQIHRLRTQPAPQPELGLDGVLPKATIQRILTEEGGTWRSEERRVGKECPQLCRSRWSPYH